MRRRVLANGSVAPDPITDPTLTNALDVCFYNSTSGKLEYYSNKDTITAIEDSGFRSNHTPIGIVVVPGSHERYGVGQGGAMMSLKPMSYDDPDNGATSETGMYWGYRVDISGITNYNKVITTSSNTTNTQSGGLSSDSFAYIPRQAAIDGTPTRNNSPYAPSPYVGSDYKSGGFNALYSTTASDSGSNRNVLADFGGQINTVTITSSSDSWKTGTISNSYTTAGVYPAAQTCARYKTVGTKSGEWYLPAAGELGYIMPRLYDINATISALQDKYGSGVGVRGDYYWSSSEYTSTAAYYVGVGSGNVSINNKGYNHHVRAFYRISPKPVGYDAAPLSVLFEKSDGSMTIQPQESWPDASTGYTPIGIVVIPGEHNVYGNGTCGVMSLKSMSYSDPDNGATSESVGYAMYWGYYSLDIPDMINYNKVITTSSNTTNTQSGGLSSNTYAYLPSQGSANGTPTRNNSPYAPSPYVGSDYKSGGFNALYATTASDTGTNHNVLADFNGIANTKIITSLSESWKTGTISNDYKTAGVYPAAQCCARYSTTGTKSFKDCTTTEIDNGTGFWYLPAAGELGYIMPRLYDINDTIYALRTKYGITVGVQLSTGYYYWSSSENSNNGAYRISTFSSAGMNVDSKGASSYVRAFLRV